MTACAPKFTACSPEPQNRFTVVPGISIGSPAASTAPRATFMPCSPTWVTQPMITSSTSCALTLARSIAPLRVRASRSTGCSADSAPLRLPRAVRNASTMTASPMVLSSSRSRARRVETPANRTPIPSAIPPPPFHVGRGLTQYLRMPKWILANDGLRPLCADRDGDGLHAHQLLDPLDVPPRVLRQLLVLALIAERLLPSGQLLVDRLRLAEQLGIGGKLADGLAVGELVRDGDQDLLEPGEHVELGHRQAGEAVHPGRVAQHQRVQPSTAARTPRGGSEFGAHRAELLPD